MGASAVDEGSGTLHDRGRDVPTQAPSAEELLDLNRASAAQLDALPGIGPVLAARIVERRAQLRGFGRTEDLLAVRGIGPKLYARIAARVRVPTARPPGRLPRVPAESTATTSRRAAPN
jgi:predicted flap endonuclease-1-like 5' DNA nuclease